MDQVCLSIGLPSNKSDKYLTGEDRDVYDNFPEMLCFRDIVFYFKILMTPTADALPAVQSWKPRVAELNWRSKPDKKSPTGVKLEVRGFETDLAKALAKIVLDKKPGLFSRMFWSRPPRAPPSASL